MLTMNLLINIMGYLDMSLFEIVWYAIFFIGGIYLIFNRGLAIKFFDALWESDHLFFKCFRYVGLAGLLYSAFEGCKELI